MEELETIFERRSFASHRQLAYNFIKEDISLKKEYQFTLKNYKSLYNPSYSIKTLKKVIPSLTYRKINDWESKHFIDIPREKKKSGWRKFSLIDIIKISIISDLRKFGYNTKNIKSIMNNISEDFLYLKAPYKPGTTYEEIEKYKRKFLLLEHHTFSCLSGNKILLLLDQENYPFLLTERMLLGWLSMISEYLSVLVLPFFSYIRKTYRLLEKDIEINKDSTIAGMANEITSFKEEQILEIIKNKKYSEILIKKLNNDELLIKSKSKIKKIFTDEEIIDIINEKEYQDIAVTRENSETVYLVQEERFKL